MDDWSGLQQQIHEWSLANFGDNDGLGPIPAFMGVGEEIGEAARAQETADYKDALADATIYLLDALAHCSVTVAGVHVMDRMSVCDDSLPSRNGSLIHCVLKRIQGIRGYEHDEFYAGELASQACVMLSSLEYIARREGWSLYAITRETFDGVVAKRTWRTACVPTTCGWWPSACAWLAKTSRSALAAAGRSLLRLSGEKTGVGSGPGSLVLACPTVIGRSMPSAPSLPGEPTTSR